MQICKICRIYKVKYCVAYSAKQYANLSFNMQNTAPCIFCIFDIHMHSPLCRWSQV